MTKFTIVQADGLYAVPFALLLHLVRQKHGANSIQRTTPSSKSCLPNPVCMITKSNIYSWIFSLLDKLYQSHGPPSQSP